MVKSLGGVAFIYDASLKDYISAELLSLGGKPTIHATLGDLGLIYCPNLDSDEVKLSPPLFAQDILWAPKELAFDSIGGGARSLKAIGRNWVSLPPLKEGLYRRTALIVEKLPYINLKPRPFKYYLDHTPPKTSIGVFSLKGEHEIFFSYNTSSHLPLGYIRLAEDHSGPPSRAYLKLEEAILAYRDYYGVVPKAGDRVLDAGASPGGWTWVMAGLGCLVTAVDKAPIDPRLQEGEYSTLVRYEAGSAFAISPKANDYDWVLSDVACYPERLLEWVRHWCDSGIKHIIATIKLQGPWVKETRDIVSLFQGIEGALVLHLYHNKHELCFFYCRGE